MSSTCAGTGKQASKLRRRRRRCHTDCTVHYPPSFTPPPHRIACADSTRAESWWSQRYKPSSARRCVQERRSLWRCRTTRGLWGGGGAGPGTERGGGGRSGPRCNANEALYMAQWHSAARWNALRINRFSLMRHPWH
jgi:hypothetical protein